MNKEDAEKYNGWQVVSPEKPNKNSDKGFKEVIQAKWYKKQYLNKKVLIFKLFGKQGPFKKLQDKNSTQVKLPNAHNKL